MDMKKLFLGSPPVLAMLLIQALTTVLQLIVKAALNEGTFVFAFMVYRLVIAAACLAPFAFFFEREKEKQLTFKVWFWLFINAVTGMTLAMALFYYGLHDTTATYATNMFNLIPVITFVFSNILGIEKLLFQTKAGKIKTAGTVICIAGALTTILYQGKSFYIGHHRSDPHVIMENKAHWARGNLLLVFSCLSVGLWYIVQVQLIKVFPLRYWATTITFIIAAVQSTVMGLCFNRSKAAWKLGWDLQLAAVVYSGAVVTPVMFCLVSWTVAKRGPTFPSMFSPLSLLFVAVCEAIFFGEAISVGSLVGMLIVTIGLYFFLWGRRQEPAILPRPTGVPREAAVRASETAGL